MLLLWWLSIEFKWEIGFGGVEWSYSGEQASMGAAPQKPPPPPQQARTYTRKRLPAAIIPST